jgi:hypothetical protein
MHRETVTDLITIKCLEDGRVRLEVEDPSTTDTAIIDLTDNEAWLLGIALMRCAGSKGKE